MSRTAYSVAEVLRAVLPRGSHSRVFSVEMIRLKWVDIVGNELALRSEPSSLGVKVLTVRVSDAVWGRMILKLQRDILARLESLVGSGVVERIQFLRDGKEPWEGGEPPSLTRKSTRQQCSESLSAPIAEAAQSITDERLRDLVTRSAARYLAAQAERRR